MLAQVAVSINPQIKKENIDFLYSLDDNQKIIYDLVKRERMRIFTQGSMLGIVLGIVMLYNLKNKNGLSKGCCFTAIVFLTQYFYYVLSPKKYSMIEVLQEKKQLREWNDVYKTYQWSYHMGMLLAVIGYFLFGYGF